MYYPLITFQNYLKQSKTKKTPVLVTLMFSSLISSWDQFYAAGSSKVQMQGSHVHPNPLTRATSPRNHSFDGARIPFGIPKSKLFNWHGEGVTNGYRLQSGHGSTAHNSTPVIGRRLVLFLVTNAGCYCWLPLLCSALRGGNDWH